MGRRKWGLGLGGALVVAASVGACRQTFGLDAYANGSADASASAQGRSACGLSYGIEASSTIYSLVEVPPSDFVEATQKTKM
jgi:hypothetical protein